MPVTSADLLERDEELTVIQRVIDAATGGDGQVVLIEGEPGIGKSSLLDAARSMARHLDMRVLEARAGELERQYANGVVLDLFSPLLRTNEDRARRLTGLAAGADPIFNAPADGAPESEPLGVLHGLYWLTVQLAEESPLLIAVDDVPWADDASARFLAYLARRIRDLPVALVMTMRPPTAEEPPPVNQLREQSAAVHVRPDRLSADAVGEMLASFGVRPARKVIEAWWSATRGTPLYIREIAQRPEAALEGPDVEETTETFSRSVRERIGGMPKGAEPLAEAIAILGNEATLDRAATLAGLDAQTAMTAVRRLTDAGLIEPRSPLEFVHPIVRSAVVTAIPPEPQDSMRRSAATTLAGEGLIVEAAMHLAGTRPRGSDRSVHVLQQAAAIARAQGDGATAVTFLERALREPPTDRVGVLRALGEAEASIGQPEAVAHYRAAVEAEPIATARAALHLELGHALIKVADWAGAMQAFEAGMALAGDSDARLTAALEAGYVSSAWVARTNLEESDAIVARISSAQELTLEQRELLVSQSFVRATAVLGTAEELSGVARRAIEGVDIDTLVRAGQTVELTTGVLFTTDDLSAGRDLLTRAIDAVPRTGMIAKLGTYSYCRAWPNYILGNLAEAAADGQAAMQAHALGWETFFPVAGGLLALIELDRGDRVAAEAAVDAVERQGWTHRTDHAVFVPLARGRLLLAAGDARGAATQFLATADAAAAVGMRSPGPAEWRSWAATALARSGDRERARQIAEEGLDIARKWGASWPIAVALRGVGSAIGGAEGIAKLREAAMVARASPSRTEETRILLELGGALRRSGSLVEARQVLSEAADLGHRIGAHGLVGLAREELVAAGGRPRRMALSGREALTPAELRVAELVVTGQSNRQVAEALFVTPKAVEYHLANAYRKLGIQSRTQLPAALEHTPATASV